VDSFFFMGCPFFLKPPRAMQFYTPTFLDHKVPLRPYLATG
jgi:hypothetical protein